MINDHKIRCKWKVQLAIKINFTSSKNSNKMQNLKILICNETDEIVQECFEFLLQKYQKSLEES